MLRKKTDYKNLENSPKNVLDRECFSKTASLQCPECSSILSRLNHRFLQEYIPKKIFRTPPLRISGMDFTK